MSPDPSSASEDHLREAAQRHFNEGRVRQSRDAYKVLCKLNRDRYLSDLVKCYKAQIDDMMRAGRDSDARSIRVYLKELCGEEYAGPAPAAPVSATEPSAPNAPDLFQKNPNDPPEAVLARDDVLAALHALCSGDLDGAPSHLQAIGLRSPMLPWKLFVKGLCAYYRGDNTQALEAFKRIAPNTPCARAAQPWTMLIENRCGEIKDVDGKETLMQGMCLALGREDLAATLPRADYLWSTGRYRDSLRHILGAPGFPGVGDRIASMLTRFYFGMHVEMSGDRTDAYIGEIGRLFPLNLARPAHGQLQMARIGALASLGTEDRIAEMRETWHVYLRIRAALKGPSPLHEALAYKAIGKSLLVTRRRPDRFDFFARHSQSTVADRLAASREFLTESIEVNDGDDETWLLLLELLKRAGKKSDFNRLLDRAVATFPENKNMLFMAGVHAVKRSAQLKGIKYFERALQLDSLDTTTREQLVLALVSLGRHYSGHTMPAYVQCMDRAVELGVDDSSHLSLSRCFLLARFAAFDFRAGYQQAAQEHLTRALSAAGDPAVLHYFTWLVFQCYDLPQNVCLDALGCFERARSTDRPLARWMIDIYEYAVLLSFRGRFDRERKRIDEQIHRELDRNQLARGDARRIIEYANQHHTDAVAKKTIKAMLKKDADDPLFRFFDCMRASNAKPAVLEHIERTAVKRHDEEALSLIRRELAKRKSEPGFGGFLGPDSDDDDDDDDGDLPDFPFSPQQMREAMEALMGTRSRRGRRGRPRF
jgi:tetratricopeptide (TPR) repeat protein